jgi:hypothetical protein
MTAPTSSPPKPPKPARRAAWPAGPDARLLIVCGLAAIFGGLLIAAAILFATDTDVDGPKPGEPVTIGLASSLETEVDEGGAIYLPDLGGGGRSVWLAEEDGELVALSARVPGTADCYVDDTGTSGVFEDCEGNEMLTTELDRYRLSVKEEPPQEGALQVEFDRIIQAPANVER